MHIIKGVPEGISNYSCCGQTPMLVYILSISVHISIPPMYAAPNMGAKSPIICKIYHITLNLFILHMKYGKLCHFYAFGFKTIQRRDGGQHCRICLKWNYWRLNCQFPESCLPSLWLFRNCNLRQCSDVTKQIQFPIDKEACSHI